MQTAVKGVWEDVAPAYDDEEYVEEEKYYNILQYDNLISLYIKNLTF